MKIGCNVYVVIEFSAHGLLIFIPSLQRIPAMRLDQSPTGSFRAYTFWTLSEARSRLYQRRFLRPRPHFSAFLKFYIFSFASFQISVIFQAFAPFFANFAKILRIFTQDSRFYKVWSNFNGFFPEFRRISEISERVMPRLVYFREI